MAAISQISRRGSQGRSYYEKKLTEGMGRKAALRALKRKISDARYARMLDDAHRRQDPGGQSGNDAATSAAGSHPETPALRTSHSRATANSALAISACSHLGLLLIAAQPARAQPESSWSPARARQRARAGTTFTPASTGHTPPAGASPPTIDNKEGSICTRVSPGHPRRR